MAVRIGRALYLTAGVLCVLSACRTAEPKRTIDPFDDSQPILVRGPARDITEFEMILEKMRRSLRIPGFSAAIAKGGSTVWAKGFGYADVEAGEPAGPETIYHLASLTKPFAATVLLQLEEEGLLSLDDPVSKYGILLQSPGEVRVLHLLSHTSEEMPGSEFRYNGNRFDQLGKVITVASGKSFCRQVNERIILPLGLRRTAPNARGADNLALNNAGERTRFYRDLAQGYSPDGDSRLAYPSYFGAAAGLMSTVLDLAAFSIALDQDRLLRPGTKKRMLSPFVSTSGTRLAYALGWFVYEEAGRTIVWHYGYWTGNSSLIVKVPDEEFTFVICANSDRLSSASRNVGADWNIRRSVVAGEFLDAFVFGDAALPEAPIQ